MKTIMRLKESYPETKMYKPNLENIQTCQKV